MGKKRRPAAIEIVDGIKVEMVGGKLYQRKENGLVEVDKSDPANKWIVAAWYNTHWATEDGKYTVVGDHVNGNPYELDDVFLERDGRIRIYDSLNTDDEIKEFFKNHRVYGIMIFTWSGKVKKIVYRTQYGLRWPPSGKGKE